MWSFLMRKKVIFGIDYTDNDEIGKLAVSFRTMSDNLKTIIVDKDNKNIAPKITYLIFIHNHVVII